MLLIFDLAEDRGDCKFEPFFESFDINLGLASNRFITEVRTVFPADPHRQ